LVNITSFAKIPPTADALTMVTNEVIGTILGDWMGAPTDEVSRIDMRKKPASMFLSETATGPKYKARALNGIWATAPYLHNGSVPNLYELLLPAAESTKKIFLGGDFHAVQAGVDTKGKSRN